MPVPFRPKHVLPALFAALLAAPAFCQSQTVCKFPPNRALGQVFFADAADPSGQPLKPFGPARGNITVPAKKILMLTMEDISPKNLKALKDCGAGIGVIRLSHTDFRDEDVKYLLPLTGLRSVYLDGTYVTDKGITELAQLPQLDFLAVNETEISGATIAGIKKLRSLDAISSDVTDAGLESLRGKDLTWLRLSKTHVTDKIIGIISGARNLNRLALAWTGVTAKSIPTIARFKKLTDINLSHIKLLDKDVAQLKNLPLQLLALEATGVGDAAFSTGFKSLSNLRLGGTKITDKCLQNISNAKDMEILDLNKNAITDAGVALLAKLRKLHTLSLVDTQITDASLKKLGALPLRDLAVSKTKVTKQGVQEFLSHHRQCRVSSDFTFD